ncbi:hypothetical protein GCM10007423_09300 [Dyadobacter endophyticus]|uniref:Tetratricopeptide repeat protein n=1 Tax=Dyadobacter endophyticus TaxID=1749036 RepID=A0ABQ1YIB5_9BACT|nr:hypothetical protein [Dyadobacter endophyticus]GGH25243.1 hypothetical protein GCM10007423_09300 [Dyadobacter endophyticus]
MELSEEIFHEIHRYLSGEGTPEERTEFEKRMHSDEALAGEVATQRRIRNGLKANEYRNLFKDIHTQLQNEGVLPAGARQVDPQPGQTIPLNPETRLAIRWPYIAAAASILVAIGLAWYFSSVPNDAPIISEVTTAEKPTGPDTTTEIQPTIKPGIVKTVPTEQKKSKTAPATVNKTEFFADYFNEKVELESPFSKEKLGLSPSALKQWRSDTAHVHQGIRLLAARDSETALQEFRQVETSRFTQVKGVAGWYIALAYLQQNDLKKCVEELKKVVADPENPNSKQAAELLTKIQ